MFSPESYEHRLPTDVRSLLDDRSLQNVFVPPVLHLIVGKDREGDTRTSLSPSSYAIIHRILVAILCKVKLLPSDDYAHTL